MLHTLVIHSSTLLSSIPLHGCTVLSLPIPQLIALVFDYYGVLQFGVLKNKAAINPQVFGRVLLGKLLVKMLNHKICVCLTLF